MMSYKIRLPMGPPEYGKFEKSDFDLEKHCGCDAFLYASVLLSEDGSLSIKFAGMDGSTQQPIDDNLRFIIWSALTYELCKSDTLGEGRKLFCNAIFETIRRVEGCKSCQ